MKSVGAQVLAIIDNLQNQAAKTDLLCTSMHSVWRDFFVTRVRNL
jgi:hypothetical protein